MVSQAEIHEMVFSVEADQRRRAAIILENEFSRLIDKDTAWKDLISLTRDQDSDVRSRAAEALGVAFLHLTDMDKAWKDLISLTGNKDSYLLWKVALALGVAFQLLTDMDTAWKDLHKLIGDQESDVRWTATIALSVAFPHLTDRDAAWKDLHRLTNDQDNDVRSRAAEAFGVAFPYLTDRDMACKDLHRLTNDQDSSVRSMAARALGEAFLHLTDKDTACKDLHRLSNDQDRLVRLETAEALGAAFPHLTDMETAWNDLHRLTNDQDSSVRTWASNALGAAFPHLTDKDTACKDLHRLTNDQDRLVRLMTVRALGAAFPHLTDMETAWNDLRKLTEDDDSGVRCSSYHSLGKISIFKATESDDEFRTHLEEAIEFFRRSSEEAEYFNPAAFCLPFYRSLYSLLFTEVPREDEVQKYLVDAKEALEAIGASESGEVLLEAVNNLSKALQEVRTYSIYDILFRKQDLKSYTKYCLQTAECLREARDKAPLASKIIDYTLVEKSIPIIDQKIKALFKDVEAVAGRLCKSTKGTDLEAFGRDAYESTKGLNEIESWIAADQYLERIVPLLKRHCSRLPREAQEHLKILVDSQDSASLEQRLNTLESVLLASLVQGENDDRRVIELKGLLDLRLQGIEFAIINMKVSSGNARKELYSLKNQIDGLQREIESQGLGKKELSKSLEERDRAMIDKLNKMREDMINAVRNTANLNASKRDFEAILKEIDNQDRLKKRDILGIITDISSLAGMALTILL